MPLVFANALLLSLLHPFDSALASVQPGMELSLGVVQTLSDGSMQGLDAPRTGGVFAQEMDAFWGLRSGIEAQLAPSAQGTGIAGSAGVRVRHRFEMEHVSPFAGAFVGYYAKKLTGSDWVHDDAGLALRGDLGASFFPHERVGAKLTVSYGGYLSNAHKNNSSYPAFVPLVTAGAEIVVRLGSL
jgi:hypothetical protein